MNPVSHCSQKAQQRAKKIHRIRKSHKDILWDRPSKIVFIVENIVMNPAWCSIEMR